MKKTKIICSIGPASNDYDTMKQMIINGMDAALIDIALPNYEDRKLAVDIVNLLNHDMGTNVATFFDTEGPDFRTGAIENKAIELVEGESIKIIKTEVLGTKDVVSVNYDQIVDKCDIGDDIIIDGGQIELQVIKKESDSLICRIINGGVLKNRTPLRVPCVDFEIDFITEKYKEDIKFACENGADFIALSFISYASDIAQIRELVTEYGRPDIQLIAKIESVKGVENIDEIIAASDGIMFSRLMLGLEVPLRTVPILQKTLIDKARRVAKTCIIAHEMLNSMCQNARPSRKEVCDVANAIIEGPDAIMLSSETQVGKYPAEAVKYMADICSDTEPYASEMRTFPHITPTNHPEAIANVVANLATDVDIKVIFAATMSGLTAKMIGNLRPDCAIIAGCPDNKICRSIALSYGIYSIVIGQFDSMEEVVLEAKKVLKETLYLQKGDKIVVTGGFPRGIPTNLMEITEID